MPRSGRPHASCASRTLALTLVAIFAASLFACGGDGQNAPSTDPGEDHDTDAHGEPDGSDGLDDVDTDTDFDTDHDTERDADDGRRDPTEHGLHGVSSVAVSLDAYLHAGTERHVRLRIWVPTALDEAQDVPAHLWIESDEDRATYAALIDEAPRDCPTRVMHLPAGEGLAPGDDLPLVILSHCHHCLGLSLSSIAIRLASHGFLVVAPDHPGNTLFDRLNGTPAPLDGTTLAARVADLTHTLDRLSDPNASELPDAIRGRARMDRVGAVGHSFGAVSVGALATEDSRVGAVMAIGAPIESPLLPGVALDAIDVPLLFMIATEDNSIMEVGNRIMRDNAERANTPVWAVEVHDAGHWSFSDICGLDAELAPGCGSATRQTIRGESFDYIPVGVGIETAATYALLFLDANLRDASTSRMRLATALDGLPVTVRARP